MSSQFMPGQSCALPTPYFSAADARAPPMGVRPPGAPMMMSPHAMLGMSPMTAMPPHVPMVPDNSIRMVVSVPPEARPNEEILIVAPDGHKFVVLVRTRPPPPCAPSYHASAFSSPSAASRPPRPNESQALSLARTRQVPPDAVPGSQFQIQIPRPGVRSGMEQHPPHPLRYRRRPDIRLGLLTPPPSHLLRAQPRWG